MVAAADDADYAIHVRLRKAEVMAEERRQRITQLTLEKLALTKDLRGARADVDEMHKLMDSRLADVRRAVSLEMASVVSDAQAACMDEARSCVETLMVRNAELEELVDEQRRSLESLRGELDGLVLFKEEREQHFAQLARTCRELDDEKLAHTADVQRLERDHLVQLESVKKEMLARVQAAKASFGAVAGKVLDTTMHTTVLEHHLMGRELIEQSQTVSQTLAENQRLRAQNKELRRRADLIEAQLEQSTRRSRVAQMLMQRQSLRRESMSAGGMGSRPGGAEAAALAAWPPHTALRRSPRPTTTGAAKASAPPAGGIADEGHIVAPPPRGHPTYSPLAASPHSRQGSRPATHRSPRRRWASSPSKAAGVEGNSPRRGDEPNSIAVTPLLWVPDGVLSPFPSSAIRSPRWRSGSGRQA